MLENIDSASVEEKTERARKKRFKKDCLRSSRSITAQSLRRSIPFLRITYDNAPSISELLLGCLSIQNLKKMTSSLL